MAEIQTPRHSRRASNGGQSTGMQADIVVIGGGATGVGVAYDLAQRGFSVVLLEKGDLGAGTSGHFHGMLHSGARYVLDDPDTAALCLRENQILQKIAATAVRDTGGYFLALNNEEADYAERLLWACRNAGIPASEIDTAELMHREPAITPATQLKHAIRVPDGSIDSQNLLAINRQAAEQAETPATFLTHHEVVHLHQKAGRINTVTAQNIRTRETVTISCGYVLNAAGVWANTISQLAGITIELVWDKGSMVVLEQCYTHAVINRCRPQADGDIIVPLDGHSIVGTTSIRMDKLGAPRVEPWEVRTLLNQAAQLVPAIDHAKVRLAYAGIRPLLCNSAHGTSNRTITRSFRVIDHSDDGLENFISVVGGKLTIYRYMAEIAADLICKKENIDKPSRTSEFDLTNITTRRTAVQSLL